MRYGYAIRKPKIDPVKAKHAKIKEIEAAFNSNRKFVQEKIYFTEVEKIKDEILKSGISKAARGTMYEKIGAYIYGRKVEKYKDDFIKEELVAKTTKLNNQLAGYRKRLDKVWPDVWNEYQIKDGMPPPEPYITFRIGGTEFKVFTRYTFAMDWLAKIKELQTSRFV